MIKFAVDGEVIALVDEPRWIRRHQNGCYVACDIRMAEGVAINSTPYNLRGYDIGGVADVDYEEVSTGEYIFKQDNAIDDIVIAMLEG